MSTPMGGYQGAKRSRGGTTASIRNAERRPLGYSLSGSLVIGRLASLQPLCVAQPRGSVCA